MPYTKEHKAQSKHKILDAAIELFSRYGFDKVSIGQVMEAAQMTHGAFYSHFESKEALYRESFLETLKNSRAARLVKGPLSIAHLTSLVTNYWNLRQLAEKSKPGPEVVLFNEIGNDNSNVKSLFEASYHNLKKMIETRIAALNKLKRLPLEESREEIADKARVILASLVGAVVVAKSISQEDERRKILQATQKQILALIGAKEDTLRTNTAL
ncbi:MAG: TetR/AcrR family transcriptional regulator [Porticoccaceae bacterium]|nr:TetR/AcrR family transcriptional regulator [Pseudomonadales bacterium]MCP5172100.1 TetR/AcrR family transcriptional regulator [Pseudomonadales bacterium]